MIALGTPAFADPASGSWTDSSYFDNKTTTWMVNVTSMVNRFLTCTINWNGVSLGSGNTAHGIFTMVLPPYPGYGAAIIGHKGVSNVGSFKYTIVCK
jgi:hypothetical protein